jgi:MFS family permease
MTNMVPSAKPFFGWIVVWSAFTIAIFGWGVGFYGPPIYLKAVQDLRGWSLGLTSAAVTFHFLSGVLVVANLPKLHRRFGLPTVTLSGAAILALGITGWAQAREPWQLFLAALLTGSGWVALGAAGINAMLSLWFVRKRPAALSTAYNGASVGGILFSPLWAGLIASFGFAAAAMAVGVAMVVIVGLLAVLVLSKSPASLGQFPDGAAGPPDAATSGDAIPIAPTLTRDAAFVTLAAGMALGLFAQIGLIAHLFSILAPTLGPQGAGFAGALMTGAAIAGRTAFGWLAPVGVDRRKLAVTSYGVQMLGCALLIAADGSIPLMLTGVCLVGLGVGNATSLPPLIVQSEFSRTQGPRAVALITAISQATYAFAPALFGLLRVGAGEAESALFLAAAGVQLVAALCFLAGAKRWLKRGAKTAAPSLRPG